MIKFGPSGNSESFYNEGHKSTVEAPKWVKERGLDIYEYSFGKGVLMGENTAKLIGAEAQKYGVEITAHAPYFINFANPDDEKGEKTGLIIFWTACGFWGLWAATGLFSTVVRKPSKNAKSRLKTS